MRKPERLKRAFAVATAVVLGCVTVAALGLWLLVRDEVATLRALAAKHPRPLPPLLSAAVRAAETRGDAEDSRRLASLMVRPSSPFHAPRRPLWRHMKNAAVIAVVTRLFTMDELLRIYAGEVYLGTIRGRTITGVSEGSRFYFGKETADLTTSEAALLAAMIRSPNVLSPVRYPERAHKRRNHVLEQMLRRGFIDERQFRRALEEPVRTIAQ